MASPMSTLMSFVNSMTSQSSSVLAISSPSPLGHSSPLVASETVVYDDDDDSNDSDAYSVEFVNDIFNQNKQRKQNAKNNGKSIDNRPKQKGNKFPCQKCGTNFKSMEMLELHQMNCPHRFSPPTSPIFADSFSSSCNICQRKFRTPHGLNIHKTKTHKRGKKSRGRSRSVIAIPSALPTVGQQNMSETPKNRYGKAATAKKSNAKVLHVPKMRKRGFPLKMEGESAFGHNRGTNGNNKRPTKKAGDGGQRARDVVHVEENQNGAVQIGNDDDEAEIIIVEPEEKYQIVPRKNLGVVEPQKTQQNCAAVVISACALSNLVTFHDVDTTRGTIGQITFQFMCNKCRGQRGVARCFRGRAYCISCCGHPDCD